MASNYEPVWASPPGDTIKDVLAERSLSVDDFSRMMQEPAGSIEALLAGSQPITLRIARSLSSAIGSSTQFWMAREIAYHAHSTRIRNEDWLAELPVPEMTTFGWLDECSSTAAELDACLKFFDIPSARSWPDKQLELVGGTALRTSNTFSSKDGALATWLRRGEIQGSTAICKPWDPEGFRVALLDAKHLTRRANPAAFIPDLQRLFGAHGVAVEIIPAPRECRASGAARFLTEERALLQLSFRYLTDDHFWFTVFHEAGHLLLHSDTGPFLEGSGRRDDRLEKEANDFAAEALIPSQFRGEMQSLRSARNVMRFARDIGISPGIVVGQMQHSGQIPPSWLNKLKKRYQWSESHTVTQQI